MSLQQNLWEPPGGSGRSPSVKQVFSHLNIGESPESLEVFSQEIGQNSLDTEQPSTVSRGILRILDWKSTVIDDLFTLLIVDKFFDHFIRNGARADSQKSSGPKMSAPELLS
jgi:hypothetical protein